MARIKENYCNKISQAMLASTMPRVSKYKVHAQKIADRIGVSVAAVRMWRRLNRVPVNPVIAKLYKKAEKV